MLIEFAKGRYQSTLCNMDLQGSYLNDIEFVPVTQDIPQTLLGAVSSRI